MHKINDIISSNHACMKGYKRVLDQNWITNSNLRVFYMLISQQQKLNKLLNFPLSSHITFRSTYHTSQTLFYLLLLLINLFQSNLTTFEVNNYLTVYNFILC
jgi:hypothetical protein